MSTRPLLLTVMVLSVGLVAALAVWDDARESASALEDFAREQASLTQVTAAGLVAQLDVVRRDANTIAANAAQGHATPGAIADGYLSIRYSPPGATARANDVPATAQDMIGLPISVVTSEGGRLVLEVPTSRLLPGSASLECPDERIVLLLPPHASRFRTVDGREVASSVIRTAMDAGHSSVRLTRPDSAALGLPSRMSMAGLARFEAGSLGRWGVAVVTCAGRERDREQRARWRVVLGVLFVAILVGAFGTVALMHERRQFALVRRLAASEREREREAVLEREGRAATMVTLAAGIAHEVSTPLGVIAGRAEQLTDRMTPGDERAVRCIRAILEQTQHIREVIQGLLHVARGGAPVLEAIDVDAVLTTVVELVGHRFAAAGVELIVAPRHDDPPVHVGLRGDPRLLEHALVNLLLNACDACSRNGRVEVTTRVDVAQIAWIVADNGAGVDPAHAARIGEPFFSTKASGEGTGLGLAVATEIVRIHRGHLTLVARQPRGTIATITLPTSTEEFSHGA